MTTVWAVVVTCAAASGVLCPVSAGAQSAPPAPIVVDACLDLDAARVWRSVRLELGGPLSALVERGVTTVHLRCEDDRVVIFVDDAVTGKSLTRSVTPPATPRDVRLRFVALATVELVSASWIEVGTSSPAPDPSAPAPSPEVVQLVRNEMQARVPTWRPPPPAPHAPSWRVVGLGSTRWFLGSASSPFEAGGGVGVASLRAGTFGVGVDLLYEHGSQSSFVGQILVDTVTLDLAATARVTSLWFELRGAAGVALGGAVLTGVAGNPTAIEGRTLVAPWGGPFARAGVTFTLGRALEIEIDAEGGAVLVPAYASAEGLRVLALDGAWFGLRLGIGAAL